MDVNLYMDHQPIDVKIHHLDLIYSDMPTVISHIQNEGPTDIIYILMCGSDKCISTCLVNNIIPINHENTTLLKLLCGRSWKVAIDYIKNKYSNPDWNNYLNRSLTPCPDALNYFKTLSGLNFLSRLRIDIGTMTQSQIQSKYDIHNDEVFKNVLIHSYANIQTVYSDEYIYKILCTIRFNYSAKFKIKILNNHSSKLIKYVFKYAEGVSINALTKCRHPAILLDIIDDNNIRTIILHQWYDHHPDIVNYLIDQGYLYPMSDYFNLDELIYNLAYTSTHDYSSIVDIILKRWPELHDYILYINYTDANMDYFIHIITKYNLDYDKIIKNMLNHDSEGEISVIRLKIKLNCLIAFGMIKIDDERINQYRSDLFRTTKLMWCAMHGKLNLVKSIINSKKKMNLMHKIK